MRWASGSAGCVHLSMHDEAAHSWGPGYTGDPLLRNSVICL